MPQLLSRMDDINWLTPSIADVLEQGAAPPGGDGSIRDQVTWIQERFNQMEIPARIVNVRATPSYTLFIVRSDADKDSNPAGAIRRGLATIADERKEWRLGFIPQLADMPEAMGILLRNDDHARMSLRRMLVRTTFRDFSSTMAFTAGNTLEQHMIVDDLAQIGSLLAIGNENTRTHFVMSVLLTLFALNTPGELRLVIAGETARAYKILTTCPHALGRLLATAESAQPLIDGMLKEIKRREGWFNEDGVSTISAYNLLLKEKGQTRLPRLVVVFDSLGDESWQGAKETWTEGLTEIVKSGGAVGIHAIVTADSTDQLPETLRQSFPVRLLTSSEAEPVLSELDSFHVSLMRFIDAAYIDQKGDVFPVELPTVSPDELKNVTEYWQRMAEHRKSEPKQPQVSGKTGVTQALTPPPELEDDHDLLEAPAPPPPATTESTRQVVSEASTSFKQATALAAYLGWIGVGPLQDIFGMTPDEAQKTIFALKAMEIIEDTDSPTPRFIAPISSSRTE